MVDIRSFLPKEKLASESFWSVVLEPGWVQAGIWRLNDDLVEVVSSSNPVVWETNEELMTACDSALSSCVSNFTEDQTEPTKTVFGVPDSWVSDGQINKQYLDQIKILCEKLALTPVGFVVLSEAISHYLKFQDGGIFNGIVIRISETDLEMSLFEAGIQLGITSVVRSVSVVEDLIEGLLRLTKDKSKPLPARMVLYDGREGSIEEVQKMILETDWGEHADQVTFLHPPRVEEITPEKKILAVSLAGGAEMTKVTGVKAEVVPAPVVTETEEHDDNLEPIAKETAVDLGFAVNRDVAAAPSVVAQPVPVPVMPQVTPVKKPLIKFGNVFKRVPLPKNIFLVGVVAFFLLAVAGFIFWWFVPTATVTIYVAPQQLTETLPLTTNVSASTLTIGDQTLTGKLISKTESGERTKATSGTIVVGDKAKGSVKLYRSGPELTVPSSTKLVSGNLTFTLDSEVKIASGSAATPATKDVAVTADKIGSNYNLAAGSSFKVGNYPTSDIEAKNDAAFAGGSSREITAVAADDQQTLKTDLVDELTKKATDELNSNLDSSQALVSGSMTTKITEEVYSAKIGDEAQTVQLKLSLEVNALVVNKKDLVAAAHSVLNAKVPNGFVLRDDQIKFGFSDSDVKITANLLPVINTAEIINNISGRYPEIAQKYLETQVPGVKRVAFTFKPKLPGRLGIIPKVKNNVKVEIQAN